MGRSWGKRKIPNAKCMSQLKHLDLQSTVGEAANKTHTQKKDK